MFSSVECCALDVWPNSSDTQHRGLQTREGAALHSALHCSHPEALFAPASLRQAARIGIADTAGNGHSAVRQSKTVKVWAAHGLLQAYAYTDKPEYLYEPPGSNAPKKSQGRKLIMRRPPTSFMPEGSKEVQCEA